MQPFLSGFEEDEALRSDYIREITLLQLADDGSIESVDFPTSPIPRTLVRFWHDQSELPDDVRACMASWERLTDEGFVLRSFDDITAKSYIETFYGQRELTAFARCEHPAMRCDYLRMCVLLAEGGFYVDADDVLHGDGWKLIFRNDRMKVQPLCYDITAGGMMPSADIWRTDLPPGDRVFYVNNDPIAAPAGHPVLRRALKRATDRLLGREGILEIQATTGPGNLTAALAAHARLLQMADQPFDFELIRDWDAIAEMRWNLSYRNDERNWRNVYGC
jgi:mannosyltransferase OCH1-like enzyme